jgi:bifunctional N-acetylglucosamine-1-phosphate-uridyltransferase/glucosamine-1-phosphate-acetyltransferase GlmU-like protein
VDCQIITQFLPLGTGNAVYESLKFLDEDIEDVYVSFGTQPLIRNETVQGCLNVHREINSDFTLATVVMDSPYAPLIRDDFGNVTGSLETHLDGANMPSRGETNVGSYWASRNALQDILVKLHQKLYSEKKERYNTISGELGYPNEMVKGCLQMGLKVEGVCIANEQEMLGIKTPESLTAIRKIVDGQL